MNPDQLATAQGLSFLRGLGTVREGVLARRGGKSVSPPTVGTCGSAFPRSRPEVVWSGPGVRVLQRQQPQVPTFTSGSFTSRQRGRGSDAQQTEDSNGREKPAIVKADY